MGGELKAGDLIRMSAFEAFLFWFAGIGVMIPGCFQCACVSW